jgi:hypothetical protein
VKRLWCELSDCLSLDGDWSYEAVASLWLSNKKHLLTNVIFAAALWRKFIKLPRVWFNPLVKLSGGNL